MVLRSKVGRLGMADGTRPTEDAADEGLDGTGAHCCHTTLTAWTDDGSILGIEVEVGETSTVTLQDGVCAQGRVQFYS